MPGGSFAKNVQGIGYPERLNDGEDAEPVALLLPGR
jgi:hypothetical protein